jgi:hypothetical protein
MEDYLWLPGWFKSQYSRLSILSEIFFVPTIDKPLKYLSILSENFLVPSIG